MKLGTIFLLAVLLLVSSAIGIEAAGFGEDYVRPQPRKTLSFPWKPKHPSEPQQVILI